MNDKLRCTWPAGKPNDEAYHDEEWGVPVHDDRKLFEFLVLDAFQAGLSWSTILNKRENFRKAFDNFNADIIALYDERKIEELLGDKGISAINLKIRSTIYQCTAFSCSTERIWQFRHIHLAIYRWENTD